MKKQIVKLCVLLLAVLWIQESCGMNALGWAVTKVTEKKRTRLQSWVHDGLLGYVPGATFLVPDAQSWGDTFTTGMTKAAEVGANVLTKGLDKTAIHIANHALPEAKAAINDAAQTVSDAAKDAIDQNTDKMIAVLKPLIEKSNSTMEGFMQLLESFHQLTQPALGMLNKLNDTTTTLSEKSKDINQETIEQLFATQRIALETSIDNKFQNFKTYFEKHKAALTTFATNTKATAKKGAIGVGVGTAALAATYVLYKQLGNYTSPLIGETSCVTTWRGLTTIESLLLASYPLKQQITDQLAIAEETVAQLERISSLSRTQLTKKGTKIPALPAPQITKLGGHKRNNTDIAPYLFYGPSDTGKTAAARVIMERSGIHWAIIDATALASSIEKNSIIQDLTKLFSWATVLKQKRILFFESIDLLYNHPTAYKAFKELQKKHASTTLVICATNNETIAQAADGFWKIKFEVPTVDNIVTLLNARLTPHLTALCAQHAPSDASAADQLLEHHKNHTLSPATAQRLHGLTAKQIDGFIQQLSASLESIPFTVEHHQRVLHTVLNEAQFQKKLAKT